MEVARRQIMESVRMFFEGRDPIAIHTIIASASARASESTNWESTSMRLLSPSMMNELTKNASGDDVWMCTFGDVRVITPFSTHKVN